MKCADLEVLLCDYVDGTLPASERAVVESHLASCPACAALLRDAAAALSFMETADRPEPPPELLTRILFQVPSRRPIPEARPGRLARWFGAWLHPLLQPRFAMGMAMTILSFSILGRVAGITPRQLTPADLHPARVWQALDDRAHRTWERARKFYQSLRVVYELQVQLREWMEQQQEEQGRAAAAEAGGPEQKPAASRPDSRNGSEAAPPSHP